MTTKVLTALSLVILSAAQIFAQQDLTRYVDPFIGTAGHGHTFPGATAPFGMVQLSPDTRLTGWDGCSGYHYSDSVIYGFSHTHLSGTGISDYGDILLMPTVGEVFLNALNNNDTAKGYASRFQHRNETASPGYYSVRLDDHDILVELTTTPRAGLHRYTFPAVTQEANIIIDLTHRDKVLDSGLRITGRDTVVGWRRSQAWAKDQIVYFAIQFSNPIISSGIAIDDKLVTGMTDARGKNVKGYFRFYTGPSRQVLARVGISAVDTNGAYLNLARELGYKSFEQVRAGNVAAWNAELSKIIVTGGSDAQLTNLYTAMYHAMLAPNVFMDVDGRYRGRDLQIHKATDFTNYTVFSLWDTFRAAHPLYALIDQKRTRDFIKTFLVQYEQGGRLPVWELAANETDTMIGYHAVPVIADAAVKGIGGFDLQKAYEAMKHSAELREHRGLGTYIDNGFIAMEDERESVSKVLEYAYDDWCIAQVARMFGRNDDYERYMKRAQSYKNVFDPVSGFMRPRSNGGWIEPFDPREVTFAFTEANSWQYTFFAPQDISGLMRLMGGPRRFARKLDQMFAAESRTTGREQVDITGLMGQYAHGNEPSHHMAYLYNYAGEPWQTQFRVRQIMDQFYKPTPDGLIGNEDCGQMSAWYVFSAAGFYPVTPGSKIYAIGSPLFPEMRFRFENGKTFVVRAPGVSEKNIYIQSAMLNGERYERSYLEHDELMAGGELVLRMGPRPNRQWGLELGSAPVVTGAEFSEMIPVPVLAAPKTFRERVTVRVQSLSPSTSVYYTTDGTEPTSKSTRYVRPFVIDKNTVVNARAIDARGRHSSVVTGSFHRIPHDWKLALLSDYSSQYTAGGDSALIDGIRGTMNWSGGAWQGYWEKDLVAVVDLGKVQRIYQVGAGFLQDIGSWIWFPRRLTIELSVDGQSFIVAVIMNDGDSNASIKDYVQAITPQNARFVRLRAANSGKNTWIFADEILIRN
ncbi:MAG TPA: GH92 family glycosyl hydrolase [Pyrinomonadaceae bacterium]|nr:GH92 family glycosyl hydrolase [Pyrinomonadaceae bacterium]